MGVFSITPRSERLNPGAIKSPVRQYRMPNVHVADTTAQWRGAADVGRGITDLAKAAAHIATDMAREKNLIEDTETETAYVDAMRSKMESPETGLFGRVKMAGDSATLQGCVAEGQEYFKTAAEDLLKEKGYSGNRKKMMLLRLKEAASPFERAMTRGVLEKTQELKVSAADKNFNSLLETWRGHMYDSDATRSVIDSFRASQRVRGLSDSTVDMNTDKIMRSMAYDFLAKSIENATEPKLKRLEEQIAKGDDGEYFGFHEAFGEYFNVKDPLAHNVATSSGANISARDGLKTLIATRRRKLDELDQARISQIAAPGFEAANTIWNPANPMERNPARLEGTEAAISALRAELDAKNADGTERLKNGSAARSMAARNLTLLEQSADAIAGEELMLGLIDEYRKNPKNPPKIWIEEKRDKDGNITEEAHPVESLLKNSRKARLAQQIQAQFDQNITPARTEATAARHKNTIAALRLAQLEGATDRNGYHKKIYDAAIAGEITLAEWDTLRREFDEVWTKGSDGKMSKKEIYAKKALATIQEVFGDKVSDAFAYNPKSGRLDQVKDSSYKGLSFEVADRYGFWSWKNWIGGGEITWTTTHKLSAAEVGELATLAGELARYDGETLTQDPITGSTEKTYFGEKIDSAKGAPFDAAAYFEKLVKKMRNDKWVDENVDYILDLTQAVQRLENQDKARGSRMSEEIYRSTSKKEEPKKNVVIKKPTTKNIGVAPKK